MRTLMKPTANMRKNATSFRPKKQQDENASEASDFLMQPFPDVYQAFGTSNDHQKPIYVSPGGRKKGHQQPLSQARKKFTHKLSYFSLNCEFEVFLD